jgi:SAM-dependent methyltransferase
LQSYKVPLPKRARFLIDKTADLFDLSQFNILCVGVRNSAEMDYFKAKGAKNVIGIDLFSIHPDILIMDMHTMTFQNSLFDMVYSSHSLEHAYDLKKVTNEFLRVLRNRGILVIEVPVNFDRKKTGTDLIDFHTWDELHSNFMPCEVIWCDSYEANEYPGETGVDAIRSIMQVHKDTHAK